MARPVDWSPLAGSDPVPGDPYEVERMGRHYRRVAAAIDRAATNLRTLASSPEDFTSRAVEALEDSCEQVADDISRAYDRYSAVAEALVAYAPALEQAQTDSARALVRAQAAIDDRNVARRRLEHADSPEQITAAENALVDAADELRRARRNLIDAVEDRDRAATTAMSAIEAIGNSGDLNDGWWDNWGSKVVQVVQQIASTVAMVCGIAALLVGWIPIIGQALAGVLATVALVASAVSLLCNIALASTGYGSWGDVALDAVAVVTFGIGRVAMSSARAGMSATQGAARMSAGSVKAAQGGSLRSLIGNQSVSAMSRQAARSSFRSGLSGAALSPGNVLVSLRRTGPDFLADLATLGSRSNWTGAWQGLVPAFQGLRTGGLAALYGNTAALEHQQFVNGLAQSVLTHPTTAGVVGSVATATNIGYTANLVGSSTDLTGLAAQIGDALGLSEPFDLQLPTDPQLP